MSDVWYARQLVTQAVAAGGHADAIRKHMTGRSGAINRRGWRDRHWGDGMTVVEPPSVRSGRHPHRGYLTT